MRRSLRTELRKGLSSKMLYIAILIGLIFCTLDVIENYEKMRFFDENIAEMQTWEGRWKTGHTGYSLFYLWMGLRANTRGASFFSTIWPVLAGMAYGWSYINERSSGVYNQIASRVGAKTYYVSKYIAVFVSGGLAVGVPMLLNLLSNALVCPYEKISAAFGKVDNGCFLSELFHTNPWAYGLIWCGMTFLCGGVAACLCFVVGTKLRHSVMVMLTPYAFYAVLNSLLVNLESTVLKDNHYCLSPLYLIQSAPGHYNPGWLIFSILGLLTLISFGVGYWQVVKHELA